MGASGSMLTQVAASSLWTVLHLKYAIQAVEPSMHASLQKLLLGSLVLKDSSRLQEVFENHGTVSLVFMGACLNAMPLPQNRFYLDAIFLGF
jgi:hypothetical protein